MVTIDLTGKVVLITGGTKGIGLATGLKFGEAGAKVYLTYKWGSADLEELKKDFKQANALEPGIIQADVSVMEDTEIVLNEIAAAEKGVDIFISNVGFAMRTLTLNDYKKRSLYKTFDYSTWPLIDYTQKIKEKFGSYPAYIVAISSDGPDHFYQGYDYVAASKSLLEFFSRYLSVHLLEQGTRVNVIRFGTVRTESFDAIFGNDFFEFMKKNGVSEEIMLTPEQCAKSVLALCSGLMDPVNGQIINVDFGLPFQDNYMMRYLRSVEK